LSLPLFKDDPVPVWLAQVGLKLPPTKQYTFNDWISVLYYLILAVIVHSRLLSNEPGDSKDRAKTALTHLSQPDGILLGEIYEEAFCGKPAMEACVCASCIMNLERVTEQPVICSPAQGYGRLVQLIGQLVERNQTAIMSNESNRNRKLSVHHLLAKGPQPQAGSEAGSSLKGQKKKKKPTPAELMALHYLVEGVFEYVYLIPFSAGSLPVLLPPLCPLWTPWAYPVPTSIPTPSNAYSRTLFCKPANGLA